MSINAENLMLFMKTFSIVCNKLLGTPAVTAARNGGWLALSFVWCITAETAPLFDWQTFAEWTFLFTFVTKGFASWTVFSRVPVISTKITGI